MPFLLNVALSLIVIYISSLLYRLIDNLINARRSGFPYIIIPWDQNAFLWVVASVPLRPWLKKNMPSWITDRLSLTIYGFEYTEKDRPFEQYAGPQGNDKTYCIVTPGLFEVSTRDPELVLEVTRRPQDFQVPGFTVLFMSKFGRNLLTTDGEDWSRQRKVLASVINERISKTVFHESIRQTEGLLSEVMEGPAAGETNRMFDNMKKITINVLSGAGMGANVEWQDKEKARPGFRLTYIEAIKIVLEGVVGPLILPRWFLDNYPPSFPGHKFLKSLSYAMDEFPAHTRHMLDLEKKRIDEAGGTTRSNIMSQLILASEQGDGRKGNNKALSEEEMMGNLFIFTGAGFDTTANTLSYALVLLARHPEWHSWLHEEIDLIMPDSDADLDYAAIYPKAIRVMAFMLETLRLFPPLIHIAKQTKTALDIQTSTGTYHFPPKATIYINTLCLHRDPAVWRNLNLTATEQRSDDDEGRFRPTRWIVPSSEGVALYQPPRGTYIPWSAGPRVCPGQKMAQVEFTSIFLKLFQKHRIEAVARKVGSEGELETTEQVDQRLDKQIEDSFPSLTLQMDGVYNVEENPDMGLTMRLCTR